MVVSKINRRKWVNGPPCEQQREISAWLHTRRATADRLILLLFALFQFPADIFKKQQTQIKKNELFFGVFL